MHRLHLGALAASIVLSGLSIGAVNPRVSNSSVIGTDRPVFLGQMVVKASALPVE